MGGAKENFLLWFRNDYTDMLQYDAPVRHSSWYDVYQWIMLSFRLSDQTLM